MSKYNSTTLFKSSYLIEFPWVKEHPKIKTSATCSLCKKEINIGGMGRAALKSYAKSTRHISSEKNIKKCPPLNMFFSGDSDSVPGPLHVSSDHALSVASTVVPISASSSSNNDHIQPSQMPASVSRPPSSVKRYLIAESVTKSEVYWCLQTVANHITFTVAARCANSFKNQFPDSEIASKLKLDRTKVGYLVVYGLAPYFEKQLFNKFKESSHIVLCFDESLNKVSQRQQMDIHIRWWNTVTNHVETRYYTSIFLGHSRSEDLLQGIEKAISPNIMGKVLQLSMDSPNVKLKLFNELQAVISVLHSHVLLNIGSCGLHTLHGAFKTGMNATKWEVVGFLWALYNLFKDSPACRADFIRYTTNEMFPLKFCAVRWVESGRVAQRAVDILPSVKKYIDSVIKDKTEPGCKSFFVVKDSLKDKLLLPKLVFFMSMCNLFEKFLREFQTDASMAPLVYHKINSIVLSLAEKVVKKEHLDQVRERLQKINISPDNLIPVKHIDIGFATKDALRSCRTTSDLEKISLKRDIRDCVLAMITKLLEKAPNKYPLTKAITCLDPSVITMRAGEKPLTACLEELVAKKWLSGIKADIIKRQYLTLFSKEHVLQQCKIYRKNGKRLHDLFTEILNAESTQEFEELRQFIGLILILLHGNASVERGFSVNKQCIIENLKEESLVALRKVCDGVSAAGGVDELEITTELMHSAKTSHARYSEHLTKKREEMKEKVDAEKERKEAAKEKQKLEAEKLRLLSDARKRAAELDEKIVEIGKKFKK